MGSPFDVSQDSDSIEGEAGDSELERNAHKAWHWVIQKHIRCQGEFHIARVSCVEDNLHVLWAPIWLVFV